MKQQMHEIFRYNVSRPRKRLKRILFLTLPFLLVCATVTALIAITNLRFFYQNGQLMTAVCICAGAAIAGTLIFFTAYAITEKAVKRRSLYTFLEICDKSLILSLYCGDAYVKGERIILRRLYVTPLARLKAVGFNDKSGEIYLHGEQNDIKAYLDRTERLDYSVESGEPDFESWWYNENCAEYLNLLRIPRLFGEAHEAEDICRKIALAKQAFDNAPKPKPYVHRESEFVKRKKAQERLKNFYNT